MLSVRHISQVQPRAPRLQSRSEAPPGVPTVLVSALALIQMPAKESLPKKCSDTFCFLTNLKYNSSCGTVGTS